MMRSLVSRCQVKDFLHVLHTWTDQCLIEIRIAKSVTMTIVTLAIRLKIPIVITLTGDKEVAIAAAMGMNACQGGSQLCWHSEFREGAPSRHTTRCQGIIDGGWRTVTRTSDVSNRQLCFLKEVSKLLRFIVCPTALIPNEKG